MTIEGSEFAEQPALFSRHSFTPVSLPAAPLHPAGNPDLPILEVNIASSLGAFGGTEPESLLYSRTTRASPPNKGSVLKVERSDTTWRNGSRHGGSVYNVTRQHSTFDGIFEGDGVDAHPSHSPKGSFGQKESWKKEWISENKEQRALLLPPMIEKTSGSQSNSPSPSPSPPPSQPTSEPSAIGLLHRFMQNVAPRHALSRLKFVPHAPLPSDRSLDPAGVVLSDFTVNSTKDSVPCAPALPPRPPSVPPSPVLPSLHSSKEATPVQHQHKAGFPHSTSVSEQLTTFFDLNSIRHNEVYEELMGLDRPIDSDLEAASSTPIQNGTQMRTGNHSIDPLPQSEITSHSPSNNHTSHRKPFSDLLHSLHPNRQSAGALHRRTPCPSPATVSPFVIIAFLKTFSIALAGFGVPAHRVESHIAACAKAFGMEGNLLALPSTIVACFTVPGEDLVQTHVIKNPGLSLNLEKLCMVDMLACGIRDGVVDIEDADRKMQHIIALPPRYGNFAQALWTGASAGALAVFFDRTWTEAFVSSVLGGIVWVVCFAVARFPDASRVTELLSAVVASFAACIVNLYIAPISAYHCAVAGVVWLLPGLSLTIAVGELAGKALACGTARAVNSAIILMQLAIGVSFPIELMPYLNLPLRTPYPQVDTSLLILSLTCFLISVCWVVLFQARPKDAPIILVASILGFLASRWGAHAGPLTGEWLGAFVVGLCGNVYSRGTGTPSTVPILTGITLLVPGSLGLKSLYQLLDAGDNLLVGLSLGVAVGLRAFMIIMGVLCANVLVRPSSDL